jgi:hypothetical protein
VSCAWIRLVASTPRSNRCHTPASCLYASITSRERAVARKCSGGLDRQTALISFHFDLQTATISQVYYWGVSVDRAFVAGAGAAACGMRPAFACWARSTSAGVTRHREAAIARSNGPDITALCRRVDPFTTAPQRGLSLSYQINYCAHCYSFASFTLRRWRDKCHGCRMIGVTSESPATMLHLRSVQPEAETSTNEHYTTTSNNLG